MAIQSNNNTQVLARQSFVCEGETHIIGIVDKPRTIPRYITGLIDAVGNVMKYQAMENHRRFFDAYESFDGHWTQMERCGYRALPGSFYCPHPLGLYLDDVFMPAFLETDTYWMHASTVQRSVALIERHGVPDIISFDHDLGEDYRGNLLPTGHELAKLLVEKVQDGDWVLPRGFTYTVHSSNFEGRKKIEGLLNPFLEQWRNGQLKIDSDTYHRHESHTQLGETS